jgi:hypothetical protein
MKVTIIYDDEVYNEQNIHFNCNICFSGHFR